MIATVAAIYYNGVNVMIAKYVSMGIFAFLFVCALIRSSEEGVLSIFKGWALWLVLFTLVNLIYGFEVKDIFPKEQAMPLMIAFSSTYLFTLDYEQLKKWFIPVGIILSFVAYMAVIEGIGSLTVNENSGGVDVAKNQIGPCFTSIAILSYVFFIEEDTRIWERVVLGVVTILNLYPALYLGCRTALLCFFVVAIFTTFRAYRVKGLVILVAIATVSIILFGKAELPAILYSSFVGQRDITDFSSMTSGRDVGIAQSLNYFFKHPLFGLYGNGDIANGPENAHLYLLYQVTLRGLIGAIPAIVLYVSICKIFYRSYKVKNTIIFALLFVALAESIAEYAPPFGPGSCFTMTYLILGIYLKDNEV